MSCDQLALLLWKNYIVRKRQPGILALIFLWPILVFLILYTVRDNVDPEYHPTCHFPSRSMPQDGLLPFVQSYICSIGNPCDLLSEYEEVPTYSNASLGPLVVDMQPILNNETILSAVKTLPKSIQLLKSMAEILTRPEIKTLFDRGIRLGDLFNNHDRIKSLLRAQMPRASPSLVDGLFESSIRLYYLIETFGSTNIDGIVCSKENLKKYMILTNEEDYGEISKVLCQLDANQIPDILSELSKHLDFSGLLGMLDRVMGKFRSYDFFQDLKRTVDIILNLKSIDKYVPSYLKIREWLPNAIMLFRNVTFKEIDLNFIKKLVDMLDPIFEKENDWTVARHGFLKLNTLLGMVKTFLHNHTIESSNDFFVVLDNMSKTIKDYSLGKTEETQITKILDMTFLVLKDGITLTEKLLNHHADQISLTAAVIDNLKYFLSENIVNTLTYASSLIENIVRMTHHVAVIHLETVKNIYDICKNYQELVGKILTNVDPVVYQNMLQSLSRLDFLERLMIGAKGKKMEEFICEKNIFNEIFDNDLRHSENQLKNIEEIICSDTGKKFVADIYQNFHFQEYGKIIENTLSTLVSMFFKSTYGIERTNLTTVVKVTRDFVSYLQSPIRDDPDWSIFRANENWSKVIEDTRSKGRLDVLGIHLSIAKIYGSRSLSYFTIVPNLENMYKLSKIILQDLKEQPINWIDQFRNNKYQLVESFYLTVTDKRKTLEILEYANFTESYCINSNPPNLIVYPIGSDEKLLKELICRVSRSVENVLMINITNVKFNNDQNGKEEKFSWTSFNDQIIQIYKYIDELLFQEDKNYNLLQLQYLKSNFKTSWTTNLTSREAWEISVGVLCKLFTVMENTLFNIQVKRFWTNIYAIAWSVSVTFDSIDSAINQIRKNDRVVNLSDLSLPKTQILLESFMTNLSPIILDGVDLISLSLPIHLITAINEYKERETDWPCVKNESIGTVLEFRKGSQSFIKELERIACEPIELIKEWRNHPVLMKARRIFQHNSNVTMPPFDWRLGYIKFRHLVKDFDDLISDTKEIVLYENPKLVPYMKALEPELEKIFEERLPNMKNKARSFLDYIDLELDKTIKVFQSSNVTMRNLWESKITLIDKLLVLGKFLSHVLHETLSLVTNILQDGSQDISLLSMLGFNNESVVGLIYNKLPYILSTVVNGLSDERIENKIVETLKNGNEFECKDMFDWWSDVKVGITVEEYSEIQKFVCNLDPENFNAYMDFAVGEEMVFRKPMNQYRSYMITLIGDLYDFAKSINARINSTIIIKKPFTKLYFEDLLMKLKDSLEYIESTSYKIVELNTERTDHKLIIEGISEALVNIAEALENLEIKNDQIYIWQAIKTGDIRQLLKIFESSPEETIALIFRLLTLDKKTGQFLPRDKLRATFCDPHYFSNYWTKKDRNYFLMKICTFDPYQVLKSITSTEFYETVEGKKNVLVKSTPLSSALIKFLDALIKIVSSHENIIVRSNIFNSTTWMNLSSDTWDVIKAAEESWVYKIVVEHEKPLEKLDESSKSLIMNGYPYVKIIKSVRLLNFLMDLLTGGGDIWQKLRNVYENSKIQPMLTLIEDIPNLVLTSIDTFLTSERLNDFADKLFQGKVNPCDIDRYLIPPSFVRKKALLSSISNFCLNVLANEKFPTAMDFLSLDVKIEKNLIVSNDKVKYWNASYFVDVVNSLASTLIRVGSEGYKNPKVPTWWTSFEEGTLKDFSLQYKKKDLRTLAHSVVNKFGNVIKDLTKTSSSDKDCSWCSTSMIDIVNTQLSRHALYAQLICDTNKLNNWEIHNRLINEFYWNKTTNMINNYKYLNDKKTLNAFITSIETTLHYIADIIVNFQNVTYKEKMDHCFKQLIGEPAFSRPGLYIKIITGILEMLEKNTFLLDNTRYHEKILDLTNLAEKYVPIWKPLVEVVKKSDKIIVNNLLANAMINVNGILNNKSHSMCRTILECKNVSVLYEFLSSKNAAKVLRYDPKLSKYPSVMDISDRLAKSLDLSLIRQEIIEWRQDASWNLTWLKQILRHLTVVLDEGGNLFDVAFKIDFQDVSNVLGMPDIVDGVVNLLKDKTIDKIFSGMHEMLEDVTPFLNDHNLIDDLNSMIVALESMEIFKNLGLLDVKYVVSDMFDNWDTVRNYLINKIHLSKETALILSEAKIDMISVFMKERRAFSLKDTICSPSKLGDMLDVHHTEITIEEISTVLCTLNDTQTQNIAITLIKNLNFDYILKTLLSANVKNILANANLTETEGKLVLDNLGVASELIPFFKDKLSGNFISPESLQSETDGGEESDAKGIMSSSEFLSDSSKMLCGKTVLDTNNRFYKMIASIEDNIKEDDKVELDSLPTDFCRETYKSVINMGAGKIIWSYIKPLLRGQILYAPDTAAIKKVMSLTNDTFVQMDHFGQLMDSFVETLKSLASLSEMGDSLNELQDILASEVMQIAIKSFGGGNFEGNFSEFNFGEIAWKLKRSKKLITMVEMLNDLLDCVLIDRMKGFSTENELEIYARSLMETNEFLAGIVFLDKETERSKRSLDYELPDNITYKIRMDVDYVPSTTRLKNQFWIPGPESNFIEDLRYLRGFIQLQDAVDRAIIKVKSQKDQNWKTLTQQMPYPCWKHIPFQTTLYESQGLQVCFFFALMMCVGSAVRHIVWERESRNSMVMSVMGLKPWRNTFAWFITSFIELSVVIICISLILLAGKILPRSNPVLVLMLLFDYVFSIVTFCYMISTIFSSASLSAITTVVMFLLTYMPYIIVIAMEAAFGLGYKLFICLSMSTSFCYGCLYVVRKEVQGTGITWKNMWEESSPGDPMSFGLILFMIALDGCIYALIGYFITKYTNSGRDFHGLRSRSLWWANTRSLYGRPSYLAFVNNLYLTNDVLHPSTTYQEDDSDVSSLTVNEKQIGVRFDNVRKVYNTDTGEVVAVDEFTLKLCEGEVTSLLGRNGAGKTTLIKMLTGMVAPTNGEICLNGEEGCKPEIGVCPQDNVLIGTMTPREHMIFYSKLKGKKNNVTMERNVNEMLSSLELGRQEHEPVYRLSGGTKRRLCVALAFLGSPKLVILDEPGAGVDPAARRRIWQLIDQHRVGRTVLLSTHHLDEADMLSDTVVVMHKGKILCTGSPLTLKMNHGRGYRLHLSYPPNDISGESIERKNLETLKKIIEGIVPNCSIDETTGTEVIVNLPFQGKHGNNNDIAQAAKVLEDNQKLLGFLHFSLECDTLERVFLDLCARADNNSMLNRVNINNSDKVNHIGLSVPNDGIDLIDFEPSPKPSALRQVKGLLKKRLWHFAKDWRSPLATFILPTMFVAVAMGFSLIRPPSVDEPPLALNPRIYDAHPTYFYSIDNSNDPFLQHVSLQLHDRFGDDYAGAWQTLPNDTGTCECVDGQQTCQGLSQAVEGLLQILPGRPTLDWIVSTHQEYIEKRYGGWSLSHWKEDPLFVVWYNNKGHHSMPSYLNALNEAILRASGVNGHLTTLNHPLKLSSDQLNRTTLLQRVADVGIALVLLLAFNLVAAQGTKELVRERLSEEKRILYLAGVHPVTYWTTALIWDFLIFGCSICLAVVVFEIFGLSTYVSKDNLAGVCLLLFLFAWAAIPFSHLAEKAFDDSSLSNMVLFCVNTFIGVSSLATILVIDILGKSQAAADARDLLHRILMIFPQYVLGDALVELSKNDIAAELLKKFHMDTYKSPLGWDLLGVHYVFLIIIGALLYVTNIIVECRLLPNFRKQNINYEVVEEDEDVVAERSRVEGGMAQEDILKTIKLRKEYRSVYGTNVAVQNLSFGVQPGKCFGLLGVNGAGKSTIFKMLTTEVIATAGRIVLKDKDIDSGPLCNGEVGYCPQTDALDGFLTPHQCLTIHAEIYGLKNVPKAVESTLQRLDLLKYAHQRVSSLSGGNKRKLCTAIAVIAPVSVILMDEPTSGMDPATKDLVGCVIKHVIKNHSSVILTSHSVADCESLCNRVGILAKAGLRCIGTSQHLKHKFGEGYVAFLRFGKPTSGSDLRIAIANHLPQAIVSSRQATAARLLVPKNEDIPVSTIFAKVRILAEELKSTDYTLSQSSLDQVLVNFSEELEDESTDSARNGFTNVCFNMDNIHMETF
ncbi:PREDICTED: uncharacterized protein LOC106791527 isoform X1 [Polistes canadensis]|uniref:uncharacterized protein LOC106791527 isoform X1 n=1 Tax=Polistes canadensis TaxID=91411 RepID=UPI000718B4D8|nr:PREDICTED: uncharacterized protein LOC106791527 isoform X1 [Polistes canadensis]